MLVLLSKYRKHRQPKAYNPLPTAPAGGAVVIPFRPRPVIGRKPVFILEEGIIALAA